MQVISKMIELHDFYFTYSLEGQPFKGGWSKVMAPDRRFAEMLFRYVHPDIFDGILNCAAVYNHDHFYNTKMPRVGNFKAFQQEFIAGGIVGYTEGEQCEKSATDLFHE